MGDLEIGDLEIGDYLLESCEELYSKGILSKNQYAHCVEQMDGANLKKIKLTEKKIFGVSRDSKEQKYRDFIESIKEVIKYINNKIEKNQKTEEIINLENHVLLLIKLVQDWIQYVSVKRHKNVESSHYDQLVYYYNKIDTNRQKLNKIEKQYKSLKLRSEHVEDKMSNKKTKRNIQINIMISLIVFLLISFVIIFLLYFI